MQLLIEYGGAAAAAEDWDRELNWLRKVVDVLGHKFVAGELDIAPSQLTDALLERERKNIHARWVKKIIRLAPEEMRAEWVRMTNDALGYEMPKRKQLKTPDEQLADMRDFLGKNAPALLEMFERGRR